MNEQKHIYLNGKIVPADDAKISVMDRGFLFGDGVYEVAAVLDGRIIDGPAHLARLERSLREIELNCPIPLSSLPTEMQAFVTSQHLEEGLVYLQVTRGAAETREFPFPDPDVVASTFVMFLAEKKLRDAPIAKTGMKAITIPEIRWARRDIKSISLLGQVLGKQAAIRADAGEALMIEDGFVTEGTTSSAAMVSAGGNLVMRPVSNKILDSITRRAVYVIAAEMKLEIEERLFTPDELFEAKEVFCASASALIHGLIEIDGRIIGNGTPGPVTRRLREIYLEIAATESPVIVKNLQGLGTNEGSAVSGSL